VGLPPAYELAFTLAFLSCYRLHADRIVYKLWDQAYELKSIADEFERELGRLSHALGKNGVTSPETPCPF